MKVLVVGSGGREHALAWKLAQSPRAEAVFVAPGNAGTAMEAGVENVAIDAGDIEALVNFARANKIGLTVIGPEAPLVDGVVNAFRDAKLRCFGPDRQAAQLEGSKAFAKHFLIKHDIPTADYASFTAAAEAIDYVRARGAPLVVKADGLAAGKGVILARTVDEAVDAVNDMLKGNRFGEAGHRVVIEEWLDGEEVSFIAMVGGGHVLPMASSQDHKARDEGDTGPNTGGMGAYSPAPLVDEAMHETIMERVMRPTVVGLAAEDIEYCGFLYAGLMIGSDGVPRVLEYNCRFGDPETQPIMMRLRSDLVDLCDAALDGRLDRIDTEWDPRPCVGVVMTAGGYPFDYRKGDVIDGLDPAGDDDLRVFHAGTRLEGEDIVTSGGRVLCVTALGESVEEAARAAYERCSGIRWKGAYYRRDIGHRAIERERTARG